MAEISGIINGLSRFGPNNVVEKTHPPEKAAAEGVRAVLSVEPEGRLGMLASATPGTRNVVNA